MIKSLLLSLGLAIIAISLFGSQPASAQTCTDPQVQNNCVDVYKDICQRANAVSPGDRPSACQDKNLGGGNPVYGKDGIISKVLNIISLVTGLGAVISIISAGIKFVTSGSNPEEVSKAREYVQYAVIGLAIAALSQALVRLVLTKISL